MVIFTDVSGQPIDPILKGHEYFSFRFFALEDGTDSLSRNVGKELPYSLRDNSEERSSHLEDVIF